MKKITALLVGHASSDIGIGHLTRLLSIAKKMEKGQILRPELIIFGEFIERSEFKSIQVHYFPIEKDLQTTLKKFISDKNHNVIIFDLHPSYFTEDIRTLLIWLKERKKILIGIDNMYEFSKYLDLVWVPSFYFNPKRVTTKNIKTGWDTYLIQKNLKSKSWKPGKNILVLTGGSDITNLGTTLPSLLEENIHHEIVINWVRGPFSRKPSIPNNTRLEWVVHNSPDQLDNLIVASNYVLTIFGVSLFETLQYGIPSVVFSPYGVKDDEAISSLREEKVAITAQNEKEATIKLNRLMNNDDLALQLSERALDKMSVNGIKGLTDEIYGLVEA